ncbi:hypothetical protein MKX08_004034 [Trichoderma sp. CBMAI-0020]|nr:hypothetical protein MKX08_004034 [Trichoderma sp. CBMAI-0020]
MAKRKAEDNDLLLQRKRTKLDSPATLDRQPSAPPSPLSEQSRKRKNPHDSQINPPVEPEAKRLKETAKNLEKSWHDSSRQDLLVDSPAKPDLTKLQDDPSVSSRDTRMEVWPGIDDDPLEEAEEDEEKIFLWRLYGRSYCTAMARIQQLENQSQEQFTRHRGGPLPSPTPSDAAIGESHPPSINHTQTDHTTPESQTMSASTTGNRPSHQRLGQRRSRKQSRHRQGHPLDQPSPTIKAILQSKRASRRDVGCTLWYLDDKGTPLSDSRLEDIPVNLAGPGAAGSRSEQLTTGSS